MLNLFVIASTSFCSCTWFIFCRTSGDGMVSEWIYSWCDFEDALLETLRRDGWCEVLQLDRSWRDLVSLFPFVRSWFVFVVAVVVVVELEGNIGSLVEESPILIFESHFLWFAAVCPSNPLISLYGLRVQLPSAKPAVEIEISSRTECKLRLDTTAPFDKGSSWSGYDAVAIDDVANEGNIFMTEILGEYLFFERINRLYTEKYIHELKFEFGFTGSGNWLSYWDEDMKIWRYYDWIMKREADGSIKKIRKTRTRQWKFCNISFP